MAPGAPEASALRATRIMAENVEWGDETSVPYFPSWNGHQTRYQWHQCSVFFFARGNQCLKWLFPLFNRQQNEEAVAISKRAELSFPSFLSSPSHTMVILWGSFSLERWSWCVLDSSLRGVDRGWKLHARGSKMSNFASHFFLFFSRSVLTHSWRLCCDIPYICVEI